MLQTCNFEISPLEEGSEIIGEVHLNWADLICQQLIFQVFIPTPMVDLQVPLLGHFFNLQSPTLVHRILIENLQLLRSSYIFGYLQKGNTYEIYNLKKQNLPIIASHILSFPNAAFLPSFLALLSIKHSHTINTIDIGITFRHDLVYYSLNECSSVIKFIFLCKLYNNAIPVENDKLLHKYLNLTHPCLKTFCGNVECQKQKHYLNYVKYLNYVREFSNE